MEKIEETKTTQPWKKIILFFSFFVLAFSLVLYYSRYIATTGLQVNEYKITDQSLPDSFHGLKIVHFSDLHYKTTYFKKELDRVVEKMNQLKPDIIVFTGDLLDQNIKYTSRDIEELQTALQSMNATIGKYAVSGENDLKVKEWETIMKNSGFTILDNKYDLIYKDSLIPIFIAGVDSSLDQLQDINTRMKDITDYLKTIQDQAGKNNIPTYRILLMHEPDYLDDITDANFSLVLAGHSHNGQVRLPGIGALQFVEGAKHYHKEHQRVDNTELFISGGLGTTHIYYRLFNTPSINFYRMTIK